MPKPNDERVQAVQIDVRIYPTAAAVESVKPAYDSMFDGQERGGGKYSDFDWRRISFILDRAVTDGDLLDVGVGAGQLLNSALRSGAFRRVVGVDKTRYEKFAELSEGVVLKKARITKLPFDDDSFDVVTCLEVLEHVNDDELLPGLAELRRVCRGQLLITVPYREAEPISATHRRRFVDDDVKRLFPNASYTLLYRPGHTWIVIEERLDGSVPTQPSPLELLQMQLEGLEATNRRLRSRRSLRFADWCGRVFRQVRALIGRAVQAVTKR